MSLPTLEKATATSDGGGDLASLVIKFHRLWHEEDDPAKCIDMCRVASECVDLEELFYGTDA